MSAADNSIAKLEEALGELALVIGGLQSLARLTENPELTKTLRNAIARLQKVSDETIKAYSDMAIAKGARQ
ncbi:MAG: hypothetical protein LBO72_11155 [Helicobacteraceae bacterium]|nr:hypothetical protein [Helicobacteraceae bacterium]